MADPEVKLRPEIQAGPEFRDRTGVQAAPDIEVRPLTPVEEARRRKRSVAIALALGAWVVLFFVLTLVKLGPQILARPM